MAVECSDTGTQFSIPSTASTTKHIKWLEKKYYSLFKTAINWKHTECPSAGAGSDIHLPLTGKENAGF